MANKRRRTVLTLAFILWMILSNFNFPVSQLSPQPAAAEAADPAPEMAADRPDGSRSQYPGFCPNDDAYNHIRVQITQIAANSTIFGNQVVNAPNTGSLLQVIPGEVVTITVRLTNDHTETLTTVQGELVMNVDGSSPQTLTPTWTNWTGRTGPGDTFSGSLAQGAFVEGQVQYTARASDPTTVNYRWYAWGYYSSDGRCDTDTADKRPASDMRFMVLGPHITVDVSAPPAVEVGNLITWTLTITNQRALATDINYANDIFFETTTYGQCTPNPGGTTIESLLSTLSLPATIGATATATFSCTMLAGYPDPVVNTVRVGATAAGLPLEFLDSATTEKSEASIKVMKFANVTEAGVGDTIIYTIRVENDGNTDLNNVTVVDTLTGLLTDVPRTMTPGQVYQQNVSYVVKDTDADPIINIVTAIGVSPRGATVGSNFSASVDKKNPALDLTMTASPTAATVGSPVTYDFQVRNTSTEGLVNVRVNFPLCGGNVPLNRTSLPAGEIATGSCVYTIQATDPDPLGFTPQTTATASAVTPQGSTITDSASVFVDILSTNLRVTLTADRQTALRGDTIVYTVSISNLTASAVTINTITSNLLGNIGATPQTLQATGQPGATYNFTVQYTVSGSDPDPLLHIVTAVDSNGNSDATSSSVDISDAQLFITVVANPPDAQSPGNPVNYDILIANNGRITLTDVRGFWQAVGRGEPESTLNIVFSDGDDVMAPFEIATAQLSRTVQSDDPDPLTVLIRIEGRDDLGLLRSFYGTATIDVLPTQLQVRKIGDASRAAVGDTVTYEFYVENVSDTGETIQNITLTDPLCPMALSGCTGNNVNLALYDPSTGALTDPNSGQPIPPGVFATSIPSLAPPSGPNRGQMAYGQIQYVVQVSDLERPEGILTNEATVQGTKQSDGQTVRDVNTWDLEVVNPLEIEKIADKVIASVGGCIFYQFTVQNIGSLSTITNITLTDPQLGWTFTRASLGPGEIWQVPDPAAVRPTDCTPPTAYPTDYQVRPGDGPRLTNVAEVTGTVNSQTVTATAEWSVEISDPVVVRKTGPALAVIGDQITYSIAITNVSETSYTILDAVDTSNSHNPATQTRTWNQQWFINNTGDATLAPGETITMQYSYTIQPHDPDELTNDFVINVQSGSSTESYSAQTTVNVYSPFLIFKIPDKFFAVVGQAIHYDYYVYNISRIRMDQISLTDDHLGRIAVRTRAEVPGGAYTTALRSLLGRTGNLVVCVPPLCDSLYDYVKSDPAAGANTYVVTPVDAQSDRLINTITVDGVTGTNSYGVLAGQRIFTIDEATVQVGNPLTITKIGPATASRGDTINYAITVTNTSPLTSGITIQNVSVVDAQTGQVALTPPNPNLAPGQSATGTATLTVPLTAGDPFTNLATASGRITLLVNGVPTTYDITSTASTTVDLTDPLLEVIFTANTTTAPRNTVVTWTAVITNNSADTPIQNVTYSDATGIDILAASQAAGTPCPTSLPISSSQTCQWTYTISDSDPDPLDNTLTVRGETPGGTPVAASDQFIIDLIDPRFRVSKTAAPNIAFIGDSIVYTITVTNTSGGQMRNVRAFDSITGPVTLTFPGGVNGILNNGETATAQIAYTISPSDPNPLVNTVTATGTSGPNQFTDSTYTTVLITASQLVVTKNPTPRIVESGDTVRYNIAITNVGRTPIRNLSVVDPAIGLDTSANPGVCGGAISHGGHTYNLTCTVDTPLTVGPLDALNPFEVAFITYTITASTLLPDPFINSVVARGVDPDGNIIEGTDTVAVDIVVPGIVLNKTANRAGASIGDTVLYTVQVTNTGASPLDNVRIVDNEIGSADIPMSVEGGPTQTQFTLGAGQTATGVITYVVTNTTPNPFINTVTMFVNGVAVDGAAASIEIRDLGISVTKTARVASAVIGDTITYDIEVRNDSNQTLTAVTATDHLSGLPVTLTDPVSGAVVTQLASGERAVGTFTYVVPVNSPDPLLNRVTATARASSGVYLSASALALVDIREADVSLSKTASTATAIVGDLVTYNFIVRNEGTSPLTNVRVTDPLCATASSGCSGGAVILTFPGGTTGTSGTLDSGEQATGNIIRAIQPADPDPLVNTALARAETFNGLTIQDIDSATVQISASDLLVTKTILGVGTCTTYDNRPVVQIGEQVAYTVQVANIGTATITDIALVDSLIGDITSTVLSTGTTLGAGGHSSGCVEIPVTAASPNPLVNTVTATGLIGTTTVTDTTSASIPVGSSGALIVTNMPDRGTASIGDTVTYTVTIRNSGLTSLTNVQATSPHAGGLIPLNTTTLAPGQSAIGTYTHQITGLDSDPFLSTVTVTTAEGLTGTATATVDVVTPGIRVTKVATPDFATVGTEIAYTITITNTGTEPLSDLHVIDLLLGGNITGCFDATVALPTPAPACTVPVNTTPVNLNPGASISATIRRTLTSSDGDPSINTVAAQGATTTQVLTDTASARVNVITANGLAVVKQADVSAAQNGDTIIYTVTALNLGTTPITNLTVNDTMAGSLIPPVTSLDVGQRMTITYTHTVNTARDRNPLINTVLVAGRNGLGQTVSDSSSASVDLLSSSDIRVTLAADRGTVLPSQAINYLATITNIGTDTLTITNVTAQFPNGTQDTTLASSLPTLLLGPGQSVTTTFPYTVLPSDPSPVVTRVTAQATRQSDGQTVSDTGAASVEITSASLALDVRTISCGIPCIVVAGSTLQIQAIVTNDGAITLTNVTLTSTPPLQTTDQTTGLILGPGASATVHYTYVVPFNVSNPLNITVDASGTDPIGGIINTSFGISLDTSNPRISVTLSADRTLAPPGSVVTYTARLSNPGSDTLQNIAAMDSTVGSVTSRLPALTLAPGATMTFTYQHTVSQSDPDPIVNTLTVSAVTAFRHTVADNDTILINVQRPELFALVTASVQSAHIGETINYNVTIINIGDGPVNNLHGSYLVDTGAGGAGVLPRPPGQSGSVFISVPNLPVGASTNGTFSHVVTTGNPNPLTFRVVISGEGLVGAAVEPVTATAFVSTPLITTDASGNPIIVGTPIPGVADPEVTKESTQPFAEPGGLVTWILTVRNPGSDPVAGIIVTDTLDSRMTLETVGINNGTIQSQGNTIVAVTDALQFNQSTVLTIVARVNEGVLPNSLLTNVGCATSVGGASSICDTAMIRVAPDAQLLPATGQAEAGTGAGYAAPTAIFLLALSLLGGLFGLNLQGYDRGMRLVLMAAMIAAVVVVAVILVAVLNGLSGGGDTPPSIQATETVSSLAQAPGETPAELPTVTTEPGPPTSIAPTAIPIPTAAGTLPPTIAPTGTPPFRPTTSRELFIPKLGLSESVPIVNLPLRNNTWDVRDLGQNIGFLQGTTWVDEAMTEAGGNTVLAGHIQITTNEPGPFRDLDLLEVGDSIFLAADGTLYEYVVDQIDVVDPHDVGVTYPTRSATLTLLTCTSWDAFRGVFDSRLIVRAHPVRSMSY